MAVSPEQEAGTACILCGRLVELEDSMPVQMVLSGVWVRVCRDDPECVVGAE